MKNISSIIEKIMSIILLMMFILCFFILISTGKSTQQRILNKDKIKSNAKTAASYVDVKLKQNDQSGKILVKENPNTNSNALVIVDNFDGIITNTWIYFDDGFLLESRTLNNSSPKNSTATKIARIDGFNIEKNNKKIKYDVSYFYNNEVFNISHIAILRSI